MRNFVVTIDGKSYSVGVEEVENTEGSTSFTQPINQVQTAPVAEIKPVTKPAANSNGEKVLSPFPGLIKNLLVAEGTTVKKDQAIVVLEAMKMDNDITAPCDGVVSFNVKSGDNVETDAVLAIIG